MAIDGSVQYNDGLLLDIILLTQYYYHWGTRINVIKMFCLLQPMILPKRFDIFSLCVGCSEGLDAFRFFFKNPRSTKTPAAKPRYMTFEAQSFLWKKDN